MTAQASPDAVIVALRETMRNRMNKESPIETAQKTLAKHGLSFSQVESRFHRRPITSSTMISTGGDE
ncbi:hypothetical protein NKJ09_32100 [Mesorhizobium sp. M0189]|uniref:hypothetical protein n=1 Tax=Mesorhizobium sp. M0189 TaxID=2956909 RepID=UPI003335FF2D